MRLATRMAVAASFLPLFTLAAQAQTAPPRTVSAAFFGARDSQPILLADRSLRTAHLAIRDTAPVDPPSPAPQPEASGDPYGFAAILNNYRASAGLPPVAYDPNLSNWASQNNAAQSRKGLGHHVNPNCFQNCVWNCADVLSAATSWMNSAGHRQNMLSPTITRFGIAYGPGPYWTWNAQ
jgi:uncharacterized protein YkwD